MHCCLCIKKDFTWQNKTFNAMKIQQIGIRLYALTNRLAKKSAKSLQNGFKDCTRKVLFKDYKMRKKKSLTRSLDQLLTRNYCTICQCKIIAQIIGQSPQRFQWHCLQKICAQNYINAREMQKKIGCNAIGNTSSSGNVVNFNQMIRAIIIVVLFGRCQ